MKELQYTHDKIWCQCLCFRPSAKVTDKMKECSTSNHQIQLQQLTSGGHQYFFTPIHVKTRGKTRILAHADHRFKVWSHGYISLHNTSNLS